jgi:2-oxo-3-hexenedioate decarboxylase
MSLDPATVGRLAGHLEAAELGAHDVLKLTDEHPGMTEADAYAIQDAIWANKLARGNRIVGFKAGLTSRAKMRQMGVATPTRGFLADYFVVSDGGDLDIATLIHPKVEPEIAFVTKAPLQGPGCTIAHVLAATDFVQPGIEVIDSRYRDFKFDIPSVIADNSSSSRFVIGGRARRVDELDLRTLGVILEINGQPVAFGAGAAVYGHPAASVAVVVNLLGQRGHTVPAGSIILSGGITEAFAVKAGDSVRVAIQELGSASLRFR